MLCALFFFNNDDKNKCRRYLEGFFDVGSSFLNLNATTRITAALALFILLQNLKYTRACLLGNIPIFLADYVKELHHTHHKTNPNTPVKERNVVSRRVPISRFDPQVGTASKSRFSENRELPLFLRPPFRLSASTSMCRPLAFLPSLSSDRGDGFPQGAAHGTRSLTNVSPLDLDWTLSLFLFLFLFI